jgi:hypothetical protein
MHFCNTSAATQHVKLANEFNVLSSASAVSRLEIEAA